MRRKGCARPVACQEQSLVVFVSKAMGSYPARQASLLARRTPQNECAMWHGEHEVVSNANKTAPFPLRLREF